MFKPAKHKKDGGCIIPPNVFRAASSGVNVVREQTARLLLLRLSAGYLTRKWYTKMILEARSPREYPRSVAKDADQKPVQVQERQNKPRPTNQTRGETGRNCHYCCRGAEQTPSYCSFPKYFISESDSHESGTDNAHPALLFSTTRTKTAYSNGGTSFYPTPVSRCIAGRELAVPGLQVWVLPTVCKKYRGFLQTKLL